LPLFAGEQHRELTEWVYWADVEDLQCLHCHHWKNEAVAKAQWSPFAKVQCYFSGQGGVDEEDKTVGALEVQVSLEVGASKEGAPRPI
jgi:hypothetical protein